MSMLRLFHEDPRRASREADPQISTSSFPSNVTRFNFQSPNTFTQMSEYWKSTPSYWCKFCSQYVRDSPLERKNHDASGKHQNNIARSLRELHKGKEREDREKQRAKDEVARLNGLVSGKPGASRDAAKPAGNLSRNAPAPAANMNPAAQRKAHAEQLAAMGVALPDDLKKEVTGVGSYQKVSERVLDAPGAGVVSGNRSLAEILAEAKRQPEDVKEKSPEGDEEFKTARKRKLEHDEDEETAPRRKAWGSNFKTYPGVRDQVDDDDVNLDDLLKGVAKKKEPATKDESDQVVKQEKADGEDIVKQEDESTFDPLSTVPDAAETTRSEVKAESTSEPAPAVVFKKRKGKK